MLSTLNTALLNTALDQERCEELSAEKEELLAEKEVLLAEKTALGLSNEDLQDEVGRLRNELSESEKKVGSMSHEWVLFFLGYSSSFCGNFMCK